MRVYRVQRFLCYVAYTLALTFCVLLLLTWRSGPHSKDIEFSEKVTTKSKIDVYTKNVTNKPDLVALDISGESTPNYNVHVFYYPWYGSPKHDGKYLHWNHRYLPHWGAQSKEAKSDTRHQPPNDIGSNFYPKLGPYSSRELRVIRYHMKQIRSTGAGVLAVSWYPPDMYDDEGEFSDSVLPMLLDQANKFNLKVCLHIEPFSGRNITTLKKALSYVHWEYGSHPAFYRRPNRSGRLLPLYYIYDSYRIDKSEWVELLGPPMGSGVSLRGTQLDGFFVGLMVEKKDLYNLKDGGFDGFYTYFGADRFTYGSTFNHWGDLARMQSSLNMTFIPSVAPGYVDDRIRPWNKKNTRGREGGAYYEKSFAKAIESGSALISITSFNEWHEGTQIEEAIPKSYEGYTYLDYMPGEPDYYLRLTRKYVRQFEILQKGQ